MKEQCTHCHNMVVGQFSPSDTRKWLTALAKKGGMKAVLTAAGSVIPGFGNVTGFIAGTAIDVIYGKDINKLVDKVADAFDDNKIYVFTCPNCGHIWNRKEDDIICNRTDTQECDKLETLIESEFDQSLTYFLDNVEQIIQSEKSTSEFISKMKEYVQIAYISSRFKAAFHFLAALAGLYFLKNNDRDDDEYSQILSVANYHIRQAISTFNSDEYRLIELLLQIQASAVINELPKKIRKAVACKIDKDYSWLKKEFYQKSLVPDVCFFKVLDMDNNKAISNEDKIALWQPLVNSPVKDFRMYANLQIYRKLAESNEYAYSFLFNAFNTKGFTLNKPDIEDVMYQQWLWAAEEYAECLYSGISYEIGQDKQRGIDMLHTISNLGTYNPCLFARNFLGELAEKDGNLQKALTYYMKAGEIGSEAAMRVRKLISGVNDSLSSHSTQSNTSDVENEYLSEIKACLEEGGEISKGERRLLEKLRIKLGISENRAAELERSLLMPQLTEEEEEYLAEYKECLAEDGTISAGERRLLNRLRDKLGISEERANELENL